MEFKWENCDINTQRAIVHGGWVVRYSGQFGVGMVFVPDPNHEWVIDVGEVANAEGVSDERSI